jgi:nitrile hydratase beta subunit
MNSTHDMGGMDGFGPIEREAHEPVFHAEWERRMFALAALASAIPFAVPYGDDHGRQEIERLHPVTYLKSSYYELWYLAHCELLRQHGIFAAALSKDRKPVTADRVMPAIEAGASPRMPANGIVARFAVGDAVVARNINPTGHTRLPRYARGKRGAIHANHGVFSFADSNARGDGPDPQHLYTVAFSARDLWGREAAATDKIYLDLWDSYLDPEIS